MSPGGFFVNENQATRMLAQEARQDTGIKNRERMSSER